MKKRIFCNLLVLVLLLGMLPVSALAGGDAQVIWSEDFEADDAFDAWTSIDANSDGFVWDQRTSIEDHGEGCSFNSIASSPEPTSDSGTPDCSDDYLISPVLDLSPGYEYELTLDARMAQAEDGPPYTRADFYVIDAGYPQDPQSLKAMPYLRFDQIVPYPEEGWRSCRYDLTAYAGKQIRLVFHHIDETANRFQLDNFKLTQYEYDSHINRICVTNVPEPEVGLGVADMRESDIQIADATNLALVPGSLEYYRTVHEHDELVTGAFEDGGEYDVVFELQVKEGAFTYANAIGSVNGRKAFVTLDDKGTADTSDDIIQIDYYYGYLHAPKQPLDTLPLFLTPPVAGKTPSFDVQPGIDGFTKTSLYWCEVHDDYTEGPMMSAAEHYESGKRYRCYFELKPDEGFCFTEKTQAVVNGEIALRHYAGLSDGGAWFYADYDALADDSCTVRFCTEYGQTPAPVTGSVGTWITLPDLPDQPDAKFGGWAYQKDAEAGDGLTNSFLLTGSRTLYAIWLDAIGAPEVGICTYGPGSDAFHTTVVMDPYADFSVVEQVQYEPVLWWTDKADVGKPSLRFRGQFDVEQTYYGQLILEADGDHYFPEAAAQAMVFSGAVLDHAGLEGRQMRIDFHLDMPGDKTLHSARICVPTRIPGYPVDASTNIGVYSLTPGVNAEPFTGLWEQKEDVGDYTSAYVGSQKPGETYYGEFLLRPTGPVIISKDIQLTIDGASEVSRYTRDDAPGLVYVIYAVKIMDTYGFTAIRRSTDNTYPCGYFRADFERKWSTLFDFAFVPGGEHWIKAMAEPGYVFLEWRKNDGTEQVISKDNPYFFTLDNNDWNIQAVFAPAHTVTFLNSHGDAPAPQSVADGGLVTEPKGLTADDYTFKGWFTDPACEHKYDFSKPVTGDLILYTGWEYTPGVSTDKADLNEAIADAGNIETDHYTDESVAAFHTALAAAKEVQADPAASQAAVDKALEDLNNAVFGLVLKPSTLDKTWLGLLITDAETELTHKELYTEASVTALENELESAKSVYAGALTQEAIDAAAGKLDNALNTLQYKTEPFRFDDVRDESKFYFNPVYWAYEAAPQITNGIDATHFGPDRGCTRGQVVTFLWRAAGCPKPAKTETAFTDVKPGAFYAKAVAWAVESKVTNGMSPTSFAPNNTCTRGQIVTFLYRTMNP